MPDPTFDSPSHKDIDKAADIYVAARDERMGASKNETEAKDHLLRKMAEHGLKSYRIPDTNLLVTVTEGAHNVSVKTVKKDGEESDGEDAEE